MKEETNKFDESHFPLFLRFMTKVLDKDKTIHKVVITIDENTNDKKRISVFPFHKPI